MERRLSKLFPRYRQRGAYMVLVSVLVVVFLGIVALVLGLGVLSTSKVRLRNLGNLTALAALDAFSRAEPGAKDSAAIDAANQYLQSTKLASSKEALGTAKV